MQLISAQLPPRLQIPGAVLIPGSRPPSLRQQRVNSINTEFAPRPRRPPPPTAIVRDVRPVIEEEEENYPPPAPQSVSAFDAEVRVFLTFILLLFIFCYKLNLSKYIINVRFE